MAGTITILCGVIHKGKAYELYAQNLHSEELFLYSKLTPDHINDINQQQFNEFFEESNLYTYVPSSVKETYEDYFSKLFSIHNPPLTCFSDPIFTSIHVPPKIKIKLIIEIAKKCRDFDRDFCIATNDNLVLDTLRVCVLWGIINKDQLKIQFYGDDTCIDIRVDRNGSVEFCPEYFFDAEEELLSILIFRKEDTLKQLPNNRYIKYLQDNPSNNNQESENQNETRRTDCSNLY